MVVDESGDDVGAGGAEALGRFRGECFRHESALPVMFGTVEAQQPLERDVPQFAGGDALCRQGHALWHGEAVVAQDGADEVVSQHFRSVWARGDGTVLSRLPDQLVCLVRTLSVLVGDGRQVGIDNRFGRHGFDYLAFAAAQDRSKVVFLQRGVVDIRARADVLRYAVAAGWLA
jgi:hypothetical protein